MKIDFVKSLIAVCLSLLLAYACYEVCDCHRVRWVITIGAFLTIGIPLVFSLGVFSTQERSSVSLNAVAGVILLVELVINGIFALWGSCIPAYIIINGLILLVFALIYNFIYRTKM